MIQFIVIFTFIFVGIQFIVVLTNLIFRQRFSKTEQDLEAPLVSILIPARNEEFTIKDILNDLISQPYQNIEVIVCDDQSEDGTSEIVKRFIKKDRRVRLLHSEPLEGGWLGKNWACYQLSKEANGEYYLFLDADVRIKGRIISQSVQYSKKHDIGLFSIFPSQKMKSLGEYFTVPLMHYILTTLLPLILVRKSRFASLSAANGQYMFFRSEVYQEQQPHLKMKSEKVEDIKIARNFKENGIKISCITGNEDVSCRMYHNYREGIQGFSKNMVAFFGNSYVGAFIFWIITTFSLLYIPVYCSTSVSIQFLLLYLGTKIMFSLVARQSLIYNIILIIPQHITMFLILINSIIYKYTKTQQWKGRAI